MPDDIDTLNSKAMYGASRSMQVLSSHVGIESFIEYLSVASRTIVQTTSVVTGTKADNRSDVEMSLNTGGGAPSVADLISATQYAFSGVFLDDHLDQTISHIDDICMDFSLQYGFSCALSDYDHLQMLYDITDICMVSLQYGSSCDYSDHCH